MTLLLIRRLSDEVTDPFMSGGMTSWSGESALCPGRIVTLSTFTFRLLGLYTASLVFPKTTRRVTLLNIRCEDHNEDSEDLHHSKL